jgi:hypothetical protein
MTNPANRSWLLPSSPTEGIRSGLAFSGYASIYVTNELLSVRCVDEDGGLFHREGWLGESQGGGKASV